MIEFDIWGNLTYYEDKILDGVWYRQTFFEKDLIKYEDFQGNYWTPEFGEFIFYNISLSENFVFGSSFFTKKIFDMNIIISEGFNWFPIAGSVMGTTIGRDLVSVQPMSTPTSNLLYLDYTYHKSKEKWYQKIKSKFYLVMSKISRIFVSNKLKIIYYE